MFLLVLGLRRQSSQTAQQLAPLIKHCNQGVEEEAPDPKMEKTPLLSFIL
jgi:hypothetical protein